MSAQTKPAPATGNETADARPKLLFFCADSDGRSRRVEGFLAQVLQHRQNHDTFRLYRIDCDRHADLAQRFRINNSPTLIVAEDKRVAARIERPRGCQEIQRALATWLR
ncbi:MAG TPA: thioredoxin family protein [Gaiellaceae bacterium]|nr:thioredoxin family protein [Gaiellaceae bacterium]